MLKILEWQIFLLQKCQSSLWHTPVVSSQFKFEWNFVGFLTEQIYRWSNGKNIRSANGTHVKGNGAMGKEFPYLEVKEAAKLH